MSPEQTAGVAGQFLLTQVWLFVTLDEDQLLLTDALTSMEPKKFVIAFLLATFSPQLYLP